MRPRPVAPPVAGRHATTCASARPFARRRARRGLGALLVLASASCGGGPTDPASLSACTGPVTASVSGGTSPTFNWSPACAVRAVLVEDGAVDVWLIEAPNGISPGVRYGAVPAGATQTTSPDPLVRGRTYDLVLLTDTQNETVPPVAVQRFTP